MRYLLLTLFLVGSGSLALASERPFVLIDSPMYKQPELPEPRNVTVFHEPTRKLWLRALERPETEFKCKAADAVLQANRRGWKGMEFAIPPLSKCLEDKKLHPTAQLAISRALVSLDAKDAAALLFEQTKGASLDLREVIEPALAKWDHKPARSEWLDRVKDPTARSRSLVLAIRALGAVKEPLAADRLRELALDRSHSVAIRLEAGRALGHIRSEGLEKDAEQLAQDGTPRGLVQRLLAPLLLSTHVSPAAIAVLQRCAGDPEAAVAEPAVARLLSLDVKHAVGSLQLLLKRNDPKLRGYAVEILRRLPSEAHFRLLADRLDDEHVDVRVQARRAMLDLATKKEFHPRIIAESLRVIGQPGWRGQEQAAIVLTRLDHKPATTPFLKLLSAGQPEVFVTVAWGLRLLAVPETLPAIHQHVDLQVKLFAGNKRLPGREGVMGWLIDLQVAQLNQLIGHLKYAPAVDTLKRYVPRMDQAGPNESRGSAIWALGLILEGKPDPALAKQLITRAEDVLSNPPEDERVRTMSLITLGRMGAKEMIARIRALNPGDGSYYPAAWALERMTGEPMGKAKVSELVDRDWFLKSLE